MRTSAPPLRANLRVLRVGGSIVGSWLAVEALNRLAPLRRGGEGVATRYRQRLVAHEFLNGAQIHAANDQPAGERVPESVRAVRDSAGLGRENLPSDAVIMSNNPALVHLLTLTCRGDFLRHVFPTLGRQPPLELSAA